MPPSDVPGGAGLGQADTVAASFVYKQEVRPNRREVRTAQEVHRQTAPGPRRRCSVLCVTARAPRPHPQCPRLAAPALRRHARGAPRGEVVTATAWPGGGTGAAPRPAYGTSTAQLGAGTHVATRPLTPLSSRQLTPRKHSATSGPSSTPFPSRRAAPGSLTFLNPMLYHF